MLESKPEVLCVCVHRTDLHPAAAGQGGASLSLSQSSGRGPGDQIHKQNHRESA